jgi:hypothetical protein
MHHHGDQYHVGEHRQLTVLFATADTLQEGKQRDDGNAEVEMDRCGEKRRQIGAERAATDTVVDQQQRDAERDAVDQVQAQVRVALVVGVRHGAVRQGLQTFSGWHDAGTALNDQQPKW